MTTFTINDAIFAPLRTPGTDPAALQNFVNALNRNPYANATFTQAVQRGDFVFELVAHDELAKRGAGAFFSNDRGTDPFIQRGDKFAIQLDKDWFVPHGTNAATFAQSQAVNSALGMVIHEADHSNRQPLFDEAYKLSSTTPDTYRPDLTGAARVAASVDLTMKAEVAGWYADLNTLSAELANGSISQGQFMARTIPGSIPGKLLAVEAQGKALGLSGDALVNYVSDNGKTAIPSDYIARYTASYAPGMDPQEVRAHLAYALNDPGQVKSFAEEVGPDGTYISNATYNSGERITTVFDGYRDNHTQTTETMQADGSYRIVERNLVSSYNSDGSFGDQTRTEYYASGQICRITDTDGAHDNADYSTRTTAYDTQGRVDSIDVRRDDGVRDWTDYDQNGSQGWGRVESRFDALGREDYATVFMDDSSRTVYDYDQTNVRGDSTWQTQVDAQGRTDWTYVTQDDGSHDWTDYDQTNVRGDSIWQSHTDAQGREDWRYVTTDDGAHEWIDFDQTNERADSIWSNRVDAWGREDWANITLDDGSRDWYDYDQDSSQGWSRVVSKFDAWGREDYASMYLDDGSRDWYDYDQNGTQGWSRVVSHFDAWGREDNASMYMDDGSRDWYDYDQDGSQGWSRVVSHYDASGREDYATMFLDDGSRNTYDYDQGGSQRWSRMESHFGANGRVEYSTTYNDDGSRLVIDHDYNNHFGEHGIITYSAAGKAHLVGWTRDGYDGLIFTPAGSVIGSNGQASGPPPSFGQFPAALPYLPAIYSDSDGDGRSWTIETPWGVFHGT